MLLANKVCVVFFRFPAFGLLSGLVLYARWVACSWVFSIERAPVDVVCFLEFWLAGSVSSSVTARSIGPSVCLVLVSFGLFAVGRELFSLCAQSTFFFFFYPSRLFSLSCFVFPCSVSHLDSCGGGGGGHIFSSLGPGVFCTYW